MRAESVIVTGADGNIGRKLVAHLHAENRRQIIQLDRRPSPARNVLQADLQRLDGAWTQHFHDADTVIHLAANPNANATWPELVEDNVDATLNVFEAARAAAVKRIVFASSLHAALGYEGHLKLIPTDLPANPISCYGISKALGERLGQRFVAQHGLSVVCLRIGWVPPVNQAPPDARRPLFLQHRWLSDQDLCQAITLAMEAPVDYGIVNITSHVSGSPWSLEEARALLGYQPRSVHVPRRQDLFSRVRARLQRGRRPD